MSALLSDGSAPSIDTRAGRTTSSSSSITNAHSERYAGGRGSGDSGLGAWWCQGTGQAPKHKPVISARELLMKLMPRDTSTEKFISPPKSRLVPVSTRSASASRGVAHREQEETTASTALALSPSQLIALKYGLKPSGPSSVPSALSSVHIDDRVSKPVQQQRAGVATAASAVDRKKAFWTAQVAGAGKATPAKSAYVSPFRSPDAFEDMWRRRRRNTGSLDARQSTDETLSRPDRRRSTNSFGISDEDNLDLITRTSPRRASSSGEATAAERVVNAAEDDIWFSDASGGTPDADKGGHAPRQELVATTADSTSTTTASGRTLSASRPRARVPLKRRRQHEELDPEVTDSYEEHWPKLPPPTVRHGAWSVGIPQC